MNLEGMLKPALVGGVLLGILSALPLISAFNCVCCAWVIGGGILAAHLYVKDSPQVVTLGKGVALGLLTGIIGAIVDSVFTIPLHFALSRFGMNLAEQMRDVFEQIPNLPPESKEALRSILAGSGGVSLFLIILTGFFKLVIYGIMAMAGGAIGVAVFEKRKTGGGPQYYDPPMPPPPPVDIPPPPPDFPRV
jgi:hypothetical protein